MKGPTDKSDRLAVVFGRRVKALRAGRNWTQEELAKAAGLGSKYISIIERGVATSSFDTVEKLARAFGVDYYQFFIPPPRRRIESIEREINTLLAQPRKIDPAKIEDFLRGLRALLRKLDRTPGG